MMLIVAVVFYLLVALSLEQIYRLCDQRGSGLWWWFRHGHTAKKVVTTILLLGGIIIASFGSWIELLVAVVFFGWSIPSLVAELYRDLTAKF